MTREEQAAHARWSEHRADQTLDYYRKKDALGMLAEHPNVVWARAMTAKIVPDRSDEGVPPEVIRRVVNW